MNERPPQSDGGCCHPDATGRSHDWLLLVSATICVVAWLAHALVLRHMPGHGHAAAFAHAVYSLLNLMWWGLALGVVAIGFLGRVPREFVMALLGPGGTCTGIARAAGAGVLLDLCNHGILMVAAKLYERGASTGQVMAFLIASPWNSFSLTLILIGLIGLPWTMAVLAGSLVVALVSGLVFDGLVRAGILPPNPHQTSLPPDFQFWPSARAAWKGTRKDARWVLDSLFAGARDSRMVLRWILFGTVVAALIQTLVPQDVFENWFGPTLAGLGLTLAAATLIEVCSEGSTPIAAQLFTRASAPGNGFTFLMAGAATDYTEILVLKETTRSWKTALFLPLVAVPQILVLGWIMNRFG